MFPLTATFYDEQQKLWSGPERKDLYHEKMTLGEATFLAFNKSPQKIIQVNDTTNERMTAQDFLAHASTLGKNLLKMGLKVGDVVGLYAQNDTHTATVMVASFLCGAPVNALFPGFDKDNVQLIYKTSTPKIIFCDLENYEIVLKVAEDLNLNCHIFLMNGELQGAPCILSLVQPKLDYESESFAFPCQNLSGNNTAVILCSSGTTGTPKGVLCSHRMLLNQSVYLNLKSDSVVCSLSNMYWASGLWNLIASLLNCCKRIVANKPYNPEYILQLIHRHKITHMLASTSQVAELSLYEDEAKMKQCLTSIDSFLVGGAKVPLIVQEKMTRILKESNSERPGLGVAYGMSELSGLLSYNAGYPYARKKGTEGKLCANKKVRIINKKGELLGPNEHGELLVSSPYTWFGYYRNPEASQKAYKDNWLYTGDIGFFDDDGFLCVCARDNDIFKSRNFQIYPQLIEDVVIQVPGVFEACVFGFPDLVASNLIACAVVRREGESGRKLTAKDICSHVKSKVGNMYHLSGGVYFIEALPKTSSGKILRHKILAIVQQQQQQQQQVQHK